MKYKVIDDNIDRHEYTVKSKITKKGNTKYTMYYSNDESWGPLIRGKKVTSITNTGNGYKINMGNYVGGLGYDTAEELWILLSLLQKVDNLSNNYKITYKDSKFKLKL